jgi:hypothetical protein
MALLMIRNKNGEVGTKSFTGKAIPPCLGEFGKNAKTKPAKP